MKSRVFIAMMLLSFFSCKEKVEKTKPEVASITESVFASGVIKSKNEYEAYATVNGIIETVFVKEGDTVTKGSPILAISNVAQRLNRENAALAAEFADFNANTGKLNEAALAIDLAKNKLRNDSALYSRQLGLWEQKIGSKVDLEQKELAYENSKNAYYSARQRYSDLQRQLNFSAQQSKKNLLISSRLENDYTLRSEIDGIVYQVNKSKGELVGAQTPLATIGEANNFILEMQVDEYDILKIRPDLLVEVALDSYKGKVFEARVSKVNPLMNERSKTFLVEAVFTEQPEVLYPHLTFEANIVIRSKSKALLLPRSFLINDTVVIKKNGKKVRVKTGLKDFRKIEIIEGVSENEEVFLPAE